MTTLMCLITVQPAGWFPLAIHESTLLHIQDADPVGVVESKVTMTPMPANKYSSGPSAKPMPPGGNVPSLAVALSDTITPSASEGGVVRFAGHIQNIVAESDLMGLALFRGGREQSCNVSAPKRRCFMSIRNARISASIFEALNGDRTSIGRPLRSSERRKCVTFVFTHAGA